MNHLSARPFRYWYLVPLLACAVMPHAQADPVPVRYQQGAFHGFLELRDPDGHVVAMGDATCVVHGARVTAETIFRFKEDVYKRQVPWLLWKVQRSSIRTPAS